MSDKKNILSQEEIDALTNNAGTEDFDGDLSEEEMDVMGEIGNIAMGSAATALSTILDEKVEITTPEVKATSFSEITGEYERPCVLVKVEYTKGLKGLNLLIIKEDDAAIIADLMMGGNGNDVSIDLDEIKISAVGEAMNQMMGSAATSLASIIDHSINITPPETNYLDLDDALDSKEYFSGDEIVISTSFRLRVGELIDSSFKQLAPVEFTKKLVRKLVETDSGGLTAKEYVAAETVEEESTDNKETVRKEEMVDHQESPQGEMAKQEVAASRNISRGSADVKRARFPDFNNGEPLPIPQNMELIHDVPLEVTVRLGRSRMTIKGILDLGEGSIIELDKLAGEPVDLLVNGKLIARGEVVVIDENFGFRVKDIITPMERINSV